jgi:hypothetical protein
MVLDSSGLNSRVGPETSRPFPSKPAKPLEGAMTSRLMAWRTARYRPDLGGIPYVGVAPVGLCLPMVEAFPAD